MLSVEFAHLMGEDREWALGADRLQNHGLPKQATLRCSQVGVSELMRSCQACRSRRRVMGWSDSA